MSSELFESYEDDLNQTISSVTKKINSQIPNYSGEQRKAAVRAAEKELAKADDLVNEMDNEARGAPIEYRTKFSKRVKTYFMELKKLDRALKDAAAGRGGGDRSALLGYEERQQYSRNRQLGATETLHKTSDRIANARRIGQESEDIGADVLGELGVQRETIIRTADKLHGTDANLGRSRKILNSMSRRIITNKLLMMGVIFLLIAILGIEIFLKLRKK